MGHSANHGLASHTTLLCDKWRSCTARSSHMDTPSPGAHMSGERPSSKRTGTSLGNVRSLQRGSFVYGTRPVYITQDSGRAIGSLKEPFVAGHLPGRIPTGRTLCGERSCPDSRRHRWEHPGRYARSRIRISHPSNRVYSASLLSG